MADKFAQLGLNAAMPLIQNYDVIYERGKDTVKKVNIPGKSRRGRGQQGSYDEYDQSRDNRRRDKSAPDGYYKDDRGDRNGYGKSRDVDVEEIQRDFSPPGRSYTEKPGRARSQGWDDYYETRSGRGNNRRRDRKDDTTSDSEASLSPRPRDRRSRREQLRKDEAAALVAGGYAKGRDDAIGSGGRNRDMGDRSSRYTPSQANGYAPSPPQANGYSPNGNGKYNPNYQNGNVNGNGGGGRARAASTAVATRSNKASSTISSSETTSSSSDVPSSGEDERQRKKIRGKELLTAGLAAVATVHAASGVYNSFEARDKRYKQVMSGEMSEEQAKKEKNKARLQDLAAIGVAALSIKGAMGKWQSTRGMHKTYTEHKHSREERHQKRQKKQEKRDRKAREEGGGGGGGNGGGGGRPGFDRGKSYNYSEPDLSRRYRDDGGGGGQGGARYQDGNPYGGYR